MAKIIQQNCVLLVIFFLISHEIPIKKLKKMVICSIYPMIYNKYFIKYLLLFNNRQNMTTLTPTTKQSIKHSLKKLLLHTNEQLAKSYPSLMGQMLQFWDEWQISTTQQVQKYIYRIYKHHGKPTASEFSIIKQFLKEQESLPASFIKAVEWLISQEKVEEEKCKLDALRAELGREKCNWEETKKIMEEMIRNKQYDEIWNVSSIFPHNLHTLYSIILNTPQFKPLAEHGFKHHRQKVHEFPLPNIPQPTIQSIQTMHPKQLLQHNKAAQSYPNGFFMQCMLSNNMTQYEQYMTQQVKTQIINNSYPSTQSIILCFKAVTNFMWVKGTCKLDKQVRKEMKVLIENNYLYSEGGKQRTQILYQHAEEQQLQFLYEMVPNQSWLMVLWATKVQNPHFIDIIPLLTFRPEPDILLEYLLQYDLLPESLLQQLSSITHPLKFKLYAKHKYHLQQLLQKGTLTEALICHSLPLSLSPTNPKQSFFLLQHRTITTSHHILTTSSAPTHSFQFVVSFYKDALINWHYVRNHQQYGNFYLNHWCDYMMESLWKVTLDEWSTEQISSELRGVLGRMDDDGPVHYSKEFYTEFNQWRFLYGLTRTPKLKYIPEEEKDQIVSRLLRLVQRNNHPLIRQYLSVVLARFYLIHSNHTRPHLLTLLQTNNIGLNAGVPVLLIIGYELLHLNQPTNQQLLLKFICCHSAYIRTICQYYLYCYTKREKHSALLEKFCQFWEKDRDSIKIMNNIRIVVDGFKEAIEGDLEYLVYERVEEAPPKEVMLRFHQDLLQIIRYFIKQHEWKESIKQNLKNKAQHLELQIQKQAELGIKPIAYKHDAPKIIVIATLLQKVHNFGNILRTLHGHNAMLVIESAQPLAHPECAELIPENCDVEVIEIKEKELLKFMKLEKNRGYKLLALEQCAGSISLQNYQFPEKFILLLGNERIGAPAIFLNEADTLLQIPQVGKVRSLNVHVSMVMCVWQSFRC